MNKHGIMASIGLWVVILWVIMALQACSFGVQVGWHGETALDDREYTQKESRK